MEAPIFIEPYDPSWPVAFEAERELLLEVLKPWLTGPIEHIGSTAVIGLPAKPVIDIMAAVASLELSRPATPRLCEVGYCYAPYRNDVMHWLCKPSPEFRTHHLHLVPFRSTLWTDRIAFRDRLRADQRLANQYAALKHKLAELYRDDRETYTEQKTSFIENVLRAAT
ncbi:MAG TPA: GrpB family protein [Casimicrobiaceae bacterium]|nr:GrpB family protein [Casimicrobiaceae bacterium]